jgi:hypothetical protein
MHDTNMIPPPPQAPKGLKEKEAEEKGIQQPVA